MANENDCMESQRKTLIALREAILTIELTLKGCIRPLRASSQGLDLKNWVLTPECQLGLFVFGPFDLKIVIEEKGNPYKDEKSRIT